MKIDEETKEKIPFTPFMMAIHLEWNLNDFPISKRTARGTIAVVLVALLIVG